MIKDHRKLQYKTYLFPHMAKRFQINCQTQLMVSVSCGFAHGIRKPPKTKHLCYLYDWNFNPLGLLNRIMAQTTEKWMRDSLASVDTLWVSREEVAQRVRPYFTGPLKLLPPDKTTWTMALKKFVSNV